MFRNVTVNNTTFEACIITIREDGFVVSGIVKDGVKEIVFRFADGMAFGKAAKVAPIAEVTEVAEVAEVKRGRGRPRKATVAPVETPIEAVTTVKRGRGRPRKIQ